MQATKSKSEYNMLVIGSTAMAKLQLSTREPKNLDIITLETELVRFLENNTCVWQLKHKKKDFYSFKDSEGLKINIFLARNGNSNQDYLNIAANRELVTDGKFMYADEAIMFSIKKSHINFPSTKKKFRKHISDYCKLHCNQFGQDVMSEITVKRYFETEKKIGIVKTFNTDIDTYLSNNALEENSQDFRKIFECDSSHLAKCQYIFNLADALALEKKIIPGIFGTGKLVSYNKALDWALKEICTSPQPSWIREFTTNNYGIIKCCNRPDYSKLFLEAISEGREKSLQGVE
jgi:hypothetical protein